MHVATRSRVEVAEEALRIALADGPRRPRDVKALASEAGLTIREDVWRRARKRLAVETTRTGGSHWWSLPGSLADEIADLIAGCERRLSLEVAFAAHCAEREASGLLATTESGQLALL